MTGDPSPAPQAYRFPRGFLWATASSAHQVEGDNRSSDWWEYEQNDQVPYRSGDGCRHYQLFERDFDMARSLGQNAHRFSIEWSRIEPVEGAWNEEALAHYRDVIGALRDRGLEPIVTLHHFTNPAWFLRRGGWTRRDSAALFARYVDKVAQHLGSSVTYWLTINEPTVYAMEGYVLGEWPPALTASWLSAAFVVRNLARAHVAAYQVLHRYRPDAKVSFAHSASVIEPCDPARRADRVVAAIRDTVLHRAFFWLIGSRPGRRHRGRHLDFLGLNYYTRNVVRSAGLGLGAVVGRACHQPHHGNDGPVSTMGWEVYPDGLAATLARFSRFGLPMLITENGIATDDESLREDFVLRHLAVIATALQDGLDVVGYCYWSLIDNFEWVFGTTQRFGLAAVNAATQERTVKRGAAAFARVCRNNALP